MTNRLQMTISRYCSIMYPLQMAITHISGGKREDWRLWFFFHSLS
ncbi:RNA-binding (RRM/RBD/RNP motifs) family protein [Zea mays]|uniref:RNA-binding (RRM/RBD/RNP motifs) family protein n=1 Tax=Zea mays TaxID=4577 RepID=A0A1D6N5R0_MAIZE|nr:RNA-binding (RRM/RBD/RNP motifs) family protein [Zea mays]